MGEIIVSGSQKVGFELKVAKKKNKATERRKICYNDSEVSYPENYCNEIISGI